MNEIAMHTDFMVPNQFNKNELLRVPTNFCLFHSTFFQSKSINILVHVATIVLHKALLVSQNTSKHWLILCRADKSDTRKAAFIEVWRG